MRIAALGNIGNDMQDAQVQAHTRSVGDARAAVRVGAHVLLQAAFVAPGLWVCGVRGWRLVGAAIAGSASFTVLSWLWATANGWELLPLGDVSTPRAAAVSAGPQGTTRFNTPLPEVIDV